MNLAACDSVKAARFFEFLANMPKKFGVTQNNV